MPLKEQVTAVTAEHDEIQSHLNYNAEEIENNQVTDFNKKGLLTLLFNLQGLSWYTLMALLHISHSSHVVCTRVVLVHGVHLSRIKPYSCGKREPKSKLNMRR